MTEKERQEMERLKALEDYHKKRIRQSNDIIKANYDRISCTLPKGTKERIAAAGESVNGLINRLVLEWLKSIDTETKKE